MYLARGSSPSSDTLNDGNMRLYIQQENRSSVICNTMSTIYTKNGKSKKSKEDELIQRFIISSLSLKRSDMARVGPSVTRGSHSFTCHPHTNHIPAFTPQPQGITALWLVLRLPTKGWPGWVDLGGWSHTEINVPHWELNPDTVTRLSTNRAWRWLTSLIEAYALTTTPDHHHSGGSKRGSENGSPPTSSGVHVEVWG